MLAVRLLVSDVDGNLCDNRLSVVFVVITNAALIFPGSGALSLAARRCGRDETTIPAVPRSWKLSGVSV